MAKGDDTQQREKKLNEIHKRYEEVRKRIDILEAESKLREIR